MRKRPGRHNGYADCSTASLFSGRNLTPRIVCEGDEPSAIADLISAGLGIGLVPDLAKRYAPSAPCPPPLA